MMERYEKLVQAVVLLAVRDWRDAVKYPKSHTAQETRAECEQFFRSRWFEAITGLNGSMVLRRLKKESHLYDE